MQLSVINVNCRLYIVIFIFKEKNINQKFKCTKFIPEIIQFNAHYIIFYIFYILYRPLQHARKVSLEKSNRHSTQRKVNGIARKKMSNYVTALPVNHYHSHQSFSMPRSIFSSAAAVPFVILIVSNRMSRALDLGISRLLKDTPG